MTNKTRIKVKNRNHGTVGYSIPDLNLRRDFQPGEVKEVTFEELFKLANTPGGDYIIQNYLIIYNEEAIDAIFNAEVEPEYYYTETEIIDLMKNGTTDEFEDCLNFAPVGVLELIKDLSVKLPLNDVAKRSLMLKKLSFDVAGAIELAQTDDAQETTKPQRKAKPKTKTEGEPVRKVVKKTIVAPSE